jgi:pullulanase/glycogen debranching enzyme
MQSQPATTSDNGTNIIEAFWETSDRGIAVLSRNWTDPKILPPLEMDPGERPLRLIRRVSPMLFGRRSGYCLNGEELVFILWPKYYPNLDWEDEAVYVGGDFNGWIAAAGKPEWQMRRETHDGQGCLVLRVPRAKCLRDKTVRFKFLTGEGRWQELPEEATNRAYDGDFTNYLMSPERTGQHMFHFWPDTAHVTSNLEYLTWVEGANRDKRLITNSEYLLSLGTDRPQGARPEGDHTDFRLFAPRASAVSVKIYEAPGGPATQLVPLIKLSDGCWIGGVPQNLHGYYYHFLVAGENIHGSRLFDPARPILDPYALATVNRAGPGIILDHATAPAAKSCFIPPAWHDLIMVEAHVRDLLAHAPIELTPLERRGFKGLTKWLRDPECYLRDLGVNAVELQPVQEFDNVHPEDYHWGYMTANYFSPASAYATAPEKGSQVEEFRELVEAFHDANLAVILDVVYNHVGEPNHLLFVDKFYYFDCDRDGRLSNWSGCGNDLRTTTPMGRRLVLESLAHLVKTYDVDGFRFDLADLVGVSTLMEVETTLKAIKPSIILIAEPWSFKGHIGHALRHTGFSCWNDGFREFITQYLLGQGNQDGAHYFLMGARWNHAQWPAQTVNYVQSHDDRAWIDRITENPGNRGDLPTLHDQRRHHLLAAILLASLGIPMLAQGQDFLHSKQGVNNTYQRGDLNALDYRRATEFPATSEYFRRWIQFRLSHSGRHFRHATHPPESYFGKFAVPDTSAVGLLYNADFSQGADRLFFAINPHPWAVTMETFALNPQDFRQIADHDRFHTEGLTSARFYWKGGKLELPGMSVGLWRQG